MLPNHARRRSPSPKKVQFKDEPTITVIRTVTLAREAAVPVPEKALVNLQGPQETEPTVKLTAKPKKARAFKPKTSEQQFKMSPDIPDEEPVVAVPALGHRKCVKTQEPTQKEIDRQMKLEDNVALEFSSKTSLRLYVDQPEGEPLPFDEMKIIDNPHIPNVWTAEMLQEFREGKACIDLQLSDLKRVLADVPDKELTPHLRLKVILDLLEVRHDVKRQEVVIKQAEDWDQAQAVHFIAENVVLDLPLEAAGKVLSFTYDVCVLLEQNAAVRSVQGPEDSRRISDKELYEISNELNKLFADGILDKDRSNFLNAMCRDYTPDADLKKFVGNATSTEECNGKAKYLRVDSRINGLNCIVMLDTGAETSLIPLWAAKQLKITRKADLKQIKICGVTGKTLVPASKEAIMIQLAGKEYEHMIWVIWSDAMESLSMPLIGMDFLKGQDLFIKLKTGELVDSDGNTMPFYEGCHKRNCQKHDENRFSRIHAAWKVVEAAKPRKRVRAKRRLEAKAKPIGDNIDVESFVASVLEPCVDETGNRIDPSKIEQESSYMFLHNSEVLRKISGAHLNKYSVRMRAPAERRLRNGLYYVVPSKDFNREYGINIPEQFAYVWRNTAEVEISNGKQERNVIPSGHPLLTVQFVTDAVEQFEKMTDCASRRKKFPPGLSVCTGSVEEVDEDNRLREEYFETVWKKIEEKESSMTMEQKEKLKEVLRRNKVFPVPGKEFATTSPYVHRIPLTPGARPKRTYRNSRKSLVDRKAIEDQVTEWLATGVIQKSSSPWAAPIVLVPKKGTTKRRLCINYQGLNNVTVKDSFPLPLIDDIMHSVGDAKYFGTLDLANGFNQIPMAVEDIPKTAFSCHLGLFEFTRMPFGLCNAPATFQRAMMETLSDLIWSCCFVYIDDIIVFGRTYEEYMGNMERVLERLSEHGLTIKPEKCSFGQTEIKYLGHVLSAEGHRIDPDRINALTHYPRPKTVADLWGFVGLAGFYRQFISNFAAVCAPLQDRLKPNADLTWGLKEERAFRKLKELLSTDPVIAHFDPNKPCELRTDASLLGIGGILRQDGKIIGCKSRSLNKAERNYSVTEWEALAVCYSIQKFRHFLEGTSFTIVTDHLPLVSMLKRGRENETENKRINKWLMGLIDFDFTLMYKKGKLHTDADAISRHPVDDPPSSDNDDCFGEFSTRIHSTGLDDNGQVFFMLVEKSATSPLDWINVMTVSREQQVNVVRMKKSRKKKFPVPVAVEDTPIDWEAIIPKNSAEMRRQQDTDNYLRQLIDLLEGKKRPLTKKDLKLQERFRLIDRVLYRPRVDGTKVHDCQCIPKGMRTAILNAAHDLPQAGHMGEARTMKEIVDKFWWHKMDSDVRRYVQTCHQCQTFKHDKTGRKGFLGRTISRYVGEIGSIDYMGFFNESTKGAKYIVVYVDHFSKFVIAKAVPRETAREAAEFLYRNVMTKIPGPETLVSDNGKHFIGEVVRVLTQLAGIKRKLTTPYHPQANTAAERVMGVLRAGIAKLSPSSDSREWDDLLDSVVYSYNTTKHSTTGYSPWEVVFGRPPKTPISDFLIHMKEEVFESYPEYIKQLVLRLTALSDSVRAAKEAEFRKNKHRLDSASKPSTYKEDDLVMVEVKSRKPGKGSNKLVPPYDGPFRIISKNTTDRWFELKSERDGNKAKKISIDLIKPYYLRKPNEFADNPKTDVTFRTDLELQEEFLPEGMLAKELPKVVADKHEEVILEGGDFKPKRLRTRYGRQTTVKQPYNDNLYRKTV